MHVQIGGVDKMKCMNVIFISNKKKKLLLEGVLKNTAYQKVISKCYHA